jgi:UDP-N-acetylmuramoyl-tripeptide--D-alanyl-D-alanine ligase
MKHILYRILRLPAKIILWRFRPKIIAITGSAGKTTTKDIVYSVLSGAKGISLADVRKTVGNLNTEVGVPLTILGFRSTYSGFGWVVCVFQAYFTALFTYHYPKILILEMGADKPGDIKYLTGIARPDIAVLTSIGPAHLENFGSIENIAKEKAELIKSLSEHGQAILNFDDQYTKKVGLDTKSNVIYFGFGEGAHFQATNLTVSDTGMDFKLFSGGSSTPVHLDSLSKGQVYAVLAAIALATEALNISLLDAVASTKSLEVPKSRMQAIRSKKGAIIIDDTYNANPLSMQMAFETLELIQDKYQRSIIVLGDMLELGEQSDKLHEQIGSTAAMHADYLLLVGDKQQAYINGAKKRKDIRAKVIRGFKDKESLTAFILTNLRDTDIILVKGSRGMAMESVVDQLK